MLEKTVSQSILQILSLFDAIETETNAVNQYSSYRFLRHDEGL